MFFGTALFLAAGFYLFFTRQITIASFFAIAGYYIAFLMVMHVACWFNVPKHLRVRPAIPDEYQLLRVGPFTEETELLLSKATFLKEQMFHKKVHQLSQLERHFTEGVWRCQIEIASGAVIAFWITFKSSESVVLDKGSRVCGRGVFLTELD